MWSRSPGRLAVRAGVSGVLRTRLLWLWPVLAALTVAVFCLTVAHGSGDYPIPLDRVLRALLGAGEATDVLVVTKLRLPRVVVALLAGAAFGLAGAVFQALTRNPLASPDVLGITHGAGAAVTAGLVLGVGAGVQLLGLAGALAAGVAIYLLAWKRGTTGYRIVLVGIGVSWMCVSLTSYLLSRTETYQAQKILGWLVGSLNGRGWPDAQPLALALVLLVPALLLLARLQRTLSLGDEVAAGLGTAIQRARMALLLIACALAAFATAAAGPILFVALAAPQIAQRLARTATPPVTSSALTGASIVMISDLISVRIMDDTALPVGVVTGVLGAPFLLWQLARTSTTGTGG